MRTNRESNPQTFKTRVTSLITAAVLSAALAACGGGGGGGGGDVGPTTPTGTTGGVTTVLPVGTGLVTFSFGETRGEFVKVSTAGVVSTLSYPCTTTNEGFLSADIRPDGMIVGLAGDLYTVDVLTGNCKRIGTPPVALTSIAVAANSNIYGISQAQDTNLLYHLIVINPNDMSKLLDVPLSGGDIGFIKGIDFGPDGKLYMSTFDAVLNHEVFQVDTTTGAVTPKFAIADPSGDIDIDSSGRLRTATTAQSIRTYDVNTGNLIGTVASTRLTQKMLVYR